MADPYDFGSAEARHDRAGEHLTYIEGQVAEFLKGNPYVLSEEDYQEVLPPLSDPYEFPIDESGYEPRGASFPLDLSIRVGETVYNLRSAMDYLIYSLARHDSGRIQKGTQFPIESGKQGFLRRRNTFLRGVADEHVAKIERYQPYRGCPWTPIGPRPEQRRQAPETSHLRGRNRLVRDGSGGTKSSTGRSHEREPGSDAGRNVPGRNPCC